MQYRNLQKKKDALSTWCSILFLKHLICAFLAVSYFQSCYGESCLPKEYQKAKYFCPLCNHKEVTLGRTLEWTFCGQHVCGHRKPLWIQNLCLICWASPSVISFVYLLLTHLVFLGVWLLCLWALFSLNFHGLHTSSSTFLSDFFLYIFISTNQCLWQLHYYKFNFISIKEDSFSAVRVGIYAVCTGFYHWVFSL